MASPFGGPTGFGWGAGGNDRRSNQGSTAGRPAFGQQSVFGSALSQPSTSISASQQSSSVVFGSPATTSGSNVAFGGFGHGVSAKSTLFGNQDTRSSLGGGQRASPFGDPGAASSLAARDGSSSFGSPTTFGQPSLGATFGKSTFGTPGGGATGTGHQSFGGGKVFGAASQAKPSGGLSFGTTGSTASDASFGQSKSIFGSKASGSSDRPVFGNASSKTTIGSATSGQERNAEPGTSGSSFGKNTSGVVFGSPSQPRKLSFGRDNKQGRFAKEETPSAAPKTGAMVFGAPSNQRTEDERKEDGVGKRTPAISFGDKASFRSTTPQSKAETSPAADAKAGSSLAVRNKPQGVYLTVGGKGERAAWVYVNQCPPHLNKKRELTKIFEGFGELETIVCMQKKGKAIVKYKEKASAQKAKKEARLSDGGSSADGRLKQHTASKSPQSTSSAKVRKGPAGIPPEDLAAYAAAIGSAPSFAGGERSQTGATVSSDIFKAKARKGPAGIPSEDLAAYAAAVGSAPSFTGGLQASSREKVSLKQATFGDSSTASGSQGFDKEARLARFGDSVNAVETSASSSSVSQATLLRGDEDDDEGMKRDLASATNLEGTCYDMCPEDERAFRTRTDELSSFEKEHPAMPLSLKEMAVKRFQRSSADHKLDIPEHVRPPVVLRRTLEYLESQLMDLDTLGEDPRLGREPTAVEVYNFVWDRTRMIRKDFILQNYRAGGRQSPICTEVHERISRYHIMAEHQLCDDKAFVAQQNMEQLGQALKSLNEYYDEAARLGRAELMSAHEAEFRCYYILIILDNGGGLDVMKYVKGLRPDIYHSQDVQFALQVFTSRRENNFARFFRLLRQATYLQACLMHRYIGGVRARALEVMNVAYQKGRGFPLDHLVGLLCFEDSDEAVSTCHELGLESSNDGVKLKGNFVMPTKKPGARRSVRWIESKIRGMSRKDVVRGLFLSSPLPPHPSTSPPVSSIASQAQQSQSSVTTRTAASIAETPAFSFDLATAHSSAPKTSAVLVGEAGPTQDELRRRREELQENKQKALERLRELEAQRQGAAERLSANDEPKESASSRSLPANSAPSVPFSFATSSWPSVASSAGFRQQGSDLAPPQVVIEAARAPTSNNNVLSVVSDSKNVQTHEARERNEEEKRKAAAAVEEQRLALLAKAQQDKERQEMQAKALAAKKEAQEEARRRKEREQEEARREAARQDAERKKQQHLEHERALQRAAEAEAQRRRAQAQAEAEARRRAEEARKKAEEKEAEERERQRLAEAQLQRRLAHIRSKQEAAMKLLRFEQWRAAARLSKELRQKLEVLQQNIAALPGQSAEMTPSERRSMLLQEGASEWRKRRSHHSIDELSAGGGLVAAQLQAEERLPEFVNLNESFHRLAQRIAERRRGYGFGGKLVWLKVVLAADDSFRLPIAVGGKILSRKPHLSLLHYKFTKVDTQTHNELSTATRSLISYAPEAGQGRMDIEDVSEASVVLSVAHRRFSNGESISRASLAADTANAAAALVLMDLSGPRAATNAELGRRIAKLVACLDGSVRRCCVVLAVCTGRKEKNGQCCCQSLERALEVLWARGEVNFVPCCLGSETGDVTGRTAGLSLEAKVKSVFEELSAQVEVTLPPPLVPRNLADLLEERSHDKLWGGSSTGSWAPNQCIQAFNDVLAELEDELTGEKVATSIWPPAEQEKRELQSMLDGEGGLALQELAAALEVPRGWNSPERLEHISRALRSIQLPYFDEDSAQATASASRPSNMRGGGLTADVEWSPVLRNAQRAVHLYVHQAFSPEDSEAARAQRHLLLMKIDRVFEVSSGWARHLGRDAQISKEDVIPWRRIYDLLIGERIHQLSRALQQCSGNRGHGGGLGSQTVYWLKPHVDQRSAVSASDGNEGSWEYVPSQSCTATFLIEGSANAVMDEKVKILSETDKAVTEEERGSDRSAAAKQDEIVTASSTESLWDEYKAMLVAEIEEESTLQAQFLRSLESLYSLRLKQSQQKVDKLLSTGSRTKTPFLRQRPTPQYREVITQSPLRAREPGYGTGIKRQRVAADDLDEGEGWHYQTNSNNARAEGPGDRFQTKYPGLANLRQLQQGIVQARNQSVKDEELLMETLCLPKQAHHS